PMNQASVHMAEARRRLKAILGAIVAGVATLVTSQVSFAQSPSISVDVSKPGHAVSSNLWGIFFEEINHAGDGGLYAELVQNRDFEATTLADGWRVEGTNVITSFGAKVSKWFTNDLP